MIYNFDNEPTTLTVGEFLTNVNTALLRHRGRIEGEVTSVKNTYATAVYFSIKDTEGDALLNCVMWRTVYQQNGVDIKEGDKVIVTGVPEIYAARGSFSLKVQTIEYAGAGALKKAYDALKQKLVAEGLLEVSRKRSLPDYSKKIGVITSRSGVVIQDFSANLGRYGFEVVMVDARVEGKDAMHELLAALGTLAKQDIDVLVIMRGGGSWESLQAFNTESVVRAIATFPRPVVTGIGHDVDVTLAELVADVGASTPTAVAEVLNESWDTMKHAYAVAETDVLTMYRQRLVETARQLDQQQAMVCRHFTKVMTSVHAQHARCSVAIHTVYRNLSAHMQVMNRVIDKTITMMHMRLVAVATVIKQVESKLTQDVTKMLIQSKESLDRTFLSMLTAEGNALRQAEQEVKQVEQQLKIYDPNRPLALGYSLSYADGKLIRNTTDVQVGQVITTVVDDGNFTSTVNKVV